MNFRFIRCAGQVMTCYLGLWLYDHKRYSSTIKKRSCQATSNNISFFLLMPLWNRCGDSIMIDVSSLCVKHIITQPWKKTKVNGKASLLQTILSQSLLEILSEWIFAPFETGRNYTSRRVRGFVLVILVYTPCLPVIFCVHSKSSDWEKPFASLDFA